MRLLFTHMRNFRFPAAWLARAANAVLIGKIHAEETHPISRVLIRAVRAGLPLVAALEVARVSPAPSPIVAATVPVYQRLGSEFMPPLDEGTLLYMPSTLPGISVTEAQRLLQAQDRIIKQFPRGRQRARQGRTGRNLHRSGAALDDGDRHRAQAARPSGGSVADVVLGLGARVAGPRFRRFTRDRLSTEQLGRRDERSAASCRASPMPGRCRSRPASTC